MSDLNNDSAIREHVHPKPDPVYFNISSAISESEDDPVVRQAYRPFLLSQNVTENDWIARLELSTVLIMVEQYLKETSNDRLKVLVLYGSLRQRLFQFFPNYFD